MNAWETNIFIIFFWSPFSTCSQKQIALSGGMHKPKQRAQDLNVFPQYGHTSEWTINKWVFYMTISSGDNYFFIKKITMKCVEDTWLYTKWNLGGFHTSKVQKIFWYWSFLLPLSFFPRNIDCLLTMGYSPRISNIKYESLGD